MLRRFVLASLVLTPLPAAAQVSAYAAPALAPSLSADAAINRFYSSSTRAPLWLQGGTLTPAGRLVLDRLRTADHEGYAPGPVLAAQIDAALAAPTGNPQSIDRLVSLGWVGLVTTLQGPVAGTSYMDAATKPRVELPDRTLFLADKASDRTAYVVAALRKSRVYEELRMAMVADAAANNGAVDPRLSANLKRARLLPTTGRYLFVNAASAELMLVENDQVQDRMRVVVGTRDTPTAPMVSKIHFAIVNPYWNVAEDLVRKIVAPRVVSGGMAYLKRTQYEAIDKYGEGATVIPASGIDWKAVAAGTEQVKMRQKPSVLNSMGKMKVPFPNDYGIFLHDTPNKPQFALNARATSNGCIRLEDAPRLAKWLFGDASSAASGTAPDQYLRLPAPIPIYVAYVTAQPTGRGIEYAKDVYAMDPAPATAATAVAASL